MSVSEPVYFQDSVAKSGYQKDGKWFFKVWKAKGYKERLGPFDSEAEMIRAKEDYYRGAKSAEQHG